MTEKPEGIDFEEFERRYRESLAAKEAEKRKLLERIDDLERRMKRMERYLNMPDDDDAW